MDIKGRKELRNDMKQNMANNKHNRQIHSQICLKEVIGEIGRGVTDYD